MFMSMSARIQKRRKSLGLTQGQLAAASGITQQMISKLERGESGSTRDIVALAMALDVTAEYLQVGTGETDQGTGDSSTIKMGSIVGLLNAVAARMNRVDPATREVVGSLILRYLDNPNKGIKLVRAIDDLLSDDDGHLV